MTTIEKINNLLQENPVILFMKGDRHLPRCGYSATAIQILTQITDKFTTYDILKDPELRQSLKDYSNWQTYPQLYIQSELIGGADIMQEMFLTGELADLIAKSLKDLT